MRYCGQSVATGGGSELPIDQIIFEKYFNGINNGVAVECGANDGLYLSSCKIFEDIGWKVINIEAGKENFDKLVINRPNSININAALFDSSGIVSVEHYEFDNGGMDKISGENGCELVKNLNCIKNSVKSVRYDEIINNPVNLFVLDVEGCEIKAIKGMENTLYWPDVFCIEHAHIGIDNLIMLLKDRYSLDYSDNLNAIFIKTV